MKQILKHLLFYSLIGAAVFFSYKKDYVSFSKINNLPIAHAGPDQSIQVPLDNILLDAHCSQNPDGIILITI